MASDLHTHSINSDGYYDLEILVGYFKEAGLEVAAVTDHNFITSVENVEGLTMIPNSLELSCEWKNEKEIHIVGYNLRKTNSYLESYFDYYIDAKTEQTRVRCKKSLQEPIFLKTGEFLYVSFGDLQDRLQRKNAYYWTDIAQVLSGKVNDIMKEEVLTREDCIGLMVGDHRAIRKASRIFDVSSLSEGTRLWYEKFNVRHIPTREGLDVIEECGGTSSLAHPYERKMEIEDIEGLLREGKLVAVECFSPKNPDAMIEAYLNLCKKHGLLISGGTDFHFGDIEDLGNIRGRQLYTSELTILPYLL